MNILYESLRANIPRHIFALVIRHMPVRNKLKRIVSATTITSHNIVSQTTRPLSTPNIIPSSLKRTTEGYMEMALTLLCDLSCLVMDHKIVKVKLAWNIIEQRDCSPDPSPYTAVQSLLQTKVV